MQNENGDLDRLQRLENKLYSLKNEGAKISRAKFHAVKKEIPKSWQEAKEQIPEDHHVARTSHFLRKMFFVSAGFFLLAILIAVYSIFFGNGGVSNEKVDVKILGSSFTDGGETLSVSIEVVNRNPVSLELADLLVEYPRGASGSDDMVRTRDSIGTIRPGESISTTKDIVLFGEIGSEKTVKATLEYRLSDSNAIFTKEATFPVTINSSPLTLDVSTVQTISSGQKMDLEINATSSAKEPIKNVLVRVEYPFGFSFEESSPEPSYNNSVFYLGDFEPGESKKINIQGVITGGDNETRAFRVYAGEQDTIEQTEISVLYNSTLETLTISRPFLDARISYGGSTQSAYVVSPNQTLPLQIVWSNNLNESISDAQIIVTFSGNAVDINSINAPNSFYNSNTGELVWSKDTVASFSRLDPGESGTLSLSLKSLPLYSTTKGLLTDPTMNISVSVKGNRFSSGVTGQEATSITNTTFKVATDFQVSAKSTYNDGPFENTGPLPPKVGTETTYTITWSATNSSNRITDAYAKATLPLYATWKGVVYPTSENISYNSATREVMWNIGEVSAGSGYGSSPKTVSFQVGLTPSSSQVGSSPELMGETTSYGLDNFVGVSLDRSWNEISTRLTADSGYSSSNSNVVE